MAGQPHFVRAHKIKFSTTNILSLLCQIVNSKILRLMLRKRKFYVNFVLSAAACRPVKFLLSASLCRKQIAAQVKF